MCGIIYLKNLKDNTPINSTIKALYLAQKHRGYEGFGFVGMNAEVIEHYRAESEYGILKFLGENYFDEIMYHHRFPTSTANTMKTAHPFKIKRGNKTYYFVHNGVISNAFELQKKQGNPAYSSLDKKKGTFNDSEALAYDFIAVLTGKQKKSFAKGSCSLLCLVVDNKSGCAEKLYFYTNGASPLKIYKDDDTLILSSETGEEDVKVGVLFYYDYEVGDIFEDFVEYSVSKNAFVYSGVSYKGHDYVDDDDYEYPPVSCVKKDEIYLYMDTDTRDVVDEIKREINKLQFDYERAVLGGTPDEIDEIWDNLSDKEDELDEVFAGFIE